MKSLNHAGNRFVDTCDDNGVGRCRRSDGEEKDEEEDGGVVVVVVVWSSLSSLSGRTTAAAAVLLFDVTLTASIIAILTTATINISKMVTWNISFLVKEEE